MSSEIFVLFHGPLPKKAALTGAMRDMDFPLSITKATGSLEQQKGFMPMRLRHENAGVEFDMFEGRDSVEEIAGRHIREIDPAVDRVAAFRWGGSEDEMLCGVCGAAALSGLVNGMVLDESGAPPRRPDEAVSEARKLLASVRPPDKRFGTSPADVKRHLKSLLKQHSDLVLIGRRLFIRPVRHLLRGALLDTSSDKYSFSLWRNLDALYAPARKPAGYGKELYGALCEVWQPHFEPLLMDVLAEDIFAGLGAITSLTDFAPRLLPGNHSEYVMTLVLAGERDRAADFVDKIEQASLVQGFDTKWEKSQWEFLARNVESVCAEAHAREAETAKARGLEGIWEPSPFPVELPAAERPGRSADPAFAPTPWPGRPSWLLQQMPDRPGEIRFAKDTYQRAGSTCLLVSLTRDEAETRHRNLEDYVLASCLADGRLLVIKRSAVSSDRLDPRHDQWPRGRLQAELSLDGTEYSVSAKLYETDKGGELELWSVDVLGRTSPHRCWQYYIGPAPAQIEISDRADGANGQSLKRSPRKAERALFACAIPGFGEFEGMVAHVVRFVRSAGFGEVR